MSKNKNVVTVELQKLLDVAVELGADVKMQSGFVKVTGPAKGYAVYPANQPACGRVDISGFTLEPLTKPHRNGTFSRVQHELDQEGKTAEQIVEAFRTVLAHMLTLAPATNLRAGKKGSTKVAKVTAKEDGTKTIEVQEDNSPAPGSDDDIRSRRELILRVAAEKGVAVSPRTASLFQEAT